MTLENIEKAKQIINAYSNEEFNDEADFSNLEDVGLLYTTFDYFLTEEAELNYDYNNSVELDIQVSVDLINNRIVANCYYARIEEYYTDDDLLGYLSCIGWDGLYDYHRDLEVKLREMNAFCEKV